MFANKFHEEAYGLVKMGNYQDAIAVFQRAINENENNPDIYNDRGVLYIHLKEEKNSLSDFNKAIDLQPDYGYRYSARAYCLDFFGNTEQAVLDYEKAIELDPSDSVAHNNLGLVQEKLGYKKRAKSHFEIADKLSKQEEKLNQLMHDLEHSDSETTENMIDNQIDNTINEESENTHLDAIIPSDNISVSENLENKKAKSSFSEFTKLFTSKEQFNAFLKFLKNGFKIK